MNGPDPLAEAVPCIECGTPTRRGDMFGLEPDLRCPPCAQGLGQRMHPSHVRRASAAFRQTSATAEGRVTALLIGFIAVVWVAWQIPVLRDRLTLLLLAIPTTLTWTGFEPKWTYH